MIYALVGHRGTGKSQLTARMKLYFGEEQVRFIDLDDEIEKKLGRSIGELFHLHDESYFRDIERQVFIEIIQHSHQKTYICLGAGFDLSIVPDTVEVLWVRRETDLDGRIFLNRPRLNPNMAPLEEFKKRAEIREQNYRERSDWTYTMPEGLFEFKIRAQQIEKEIFTASSPLIGGIQTILPANFKSERAWMSFKNRYSNKGITFELRNDYLNTSQIAHAVRELAGEKLIYSFRGDRDFSQLPRCAFYDWALEDEDIQDFLLNVPMEKRIFSLHECKVGESLEQAMSRLESYRDRSIFLKFSPLVENFVDLKKIYTWQQRDPLFYSILPRSVEGRWNWFRLFLKSKQTLNFWREGDGSAPDQPSLFSWLSTPADFHNFAAVLGDPVKHSYSPVEHLDYFAKQSTPFFAVKIALAEWEDGFAFLQEIGLRWAAVTAPLKEKASDVVATTLWAVNTLMFKDHEWFGTSTDGVGLLALIEGVGALAPLQSQIAVWGGGGVLEMVRQVLPRAVYYSSRTGCRRDVDGQGTRLAASKEAGPQILLWATPRQQEFQFPPEHWRPVMVIDLNYKEDSLGREYAQKNNVNYESGVAMFVAQAQAQKAFWNKMSNQFGDE